MSRGLGDVYKRQQIGYKYKNSDKMKQSYVKTAEEAIKKAEAVQYRFLTQEEFGSGQVPDSVWEAGALEEQLDSLHRIARIDQEKAAGKLKERLCGVKRAKSRRLRILRLAVAAAAAAAVVACSKSACRMAQSL